MISLPQGITVYKYDVLSSTMDAAHNFLDFDLSDFIVILADQQEKARGREDREWHSPKGNIYMSIVLNDIDINGLGILISLAMHRVMSRYLPNKDIKIKWPNDIMVNGLKISGTLMERAFNKVIIGIGVNVEIVPQSVQEIATCLVKEGCDIKCEEVISSLLKEIFQSLNEFNAIDKNLIDRYIKNMYLLNKMIEVSCHNKLIKGILKGINQDGNAVIETSGNNNVYISFGDIFS